MNINTIAKKLGDLKFWFTIPTESVINSDGKFRANIAFQGEPGSKISFSAKPIELLLDGKKKIEVAPRYTSESYKKKATDQPIVTQTKNLDHTFLVPKGYNSNLFEMSVELDVQAAIVDVLIPDIFYNGQKIPSQSFRMYEWMKSWSVVPPDCFQ